VKIELKNFQVARTGELLKKFRSAVHDYAASNDGQALALSAPTGSGKTVMAASFIEQVLFGSEEVVGDETFVFLWLTDQPQLNEQTANKMLDTSDIDADRLVIIDDSFADDFLKPGRVYFLNTQKLGVNSSLVNTGGIRNTSLWDAIATTVADDPGRFVLIIDEAHRGMKDAKADPEFASTIVQRFIKGSVEHHLSAVPLVVGISATIGRFHDLIGTTSRTERKVEVGVAEVRASGLVKDLTRLKNTTTGQGTDMTLLIEAINDWKEFRDLWGQYATSQGMTLLDPILLVQVEDGTASVLSKSPLAEILSTIEAELEPADSSWVAHAFQTGTNIGPEEYGYPVRFLAPAEINADEDVRVVLFKSSLNTGWDCPRAEVMVSFRTAKDPTSIAQLVGRMVRARLAKHIVRFEVLNTAIVLLPKYETKAVKQVVDLLNGAGAAQTGSNAQEESEIRWMVRATGPEMESSFALLDSLPSVLMPAKVKIPPIDRLFRLAGLLAETKFAKTPVEDASKALVDLLLSGYEQRNATSAFKQAVGNARTATIVSHDHEYGATAAGLIQETETETLAASDLAGRFTTAEQSLNSRGLAYGYLAARIEHGCSEDQAKAEFYALAYDGSLLPELLGAAEILTNQWLAEYKTRLAKLKNDDEERYQRYIDLIASAGKPGVGTVAVPDGTVEWSRAPISDKAESWPRHIYVSKADGTFFEELNTWEKIVLTHELADPNAVAWFRNPPRKPWSFRVAYQSGTDYTPVYPDFLLFRRNAAGDLEASVVDPHLVNDAQAPQRAAGLAQFAAEHSESFERIDLIVVERASGSVDTIKRLRLMDPVTREQVAKVSSVEHLKALFDNAPLYP